MEGGVSCSFSFGWDVKVLDQILEPSQFILLPDAIQSYHVYIIYIPILRNVGGWKSIAALYTSSVIWLATITFNPWDPTCLIRDKDVQSCPRPQVSLRLSPDSPRCLPALFLIFNQNQAMSQWREYWDNIILCIFRQFIQNKHAEWSNPWLGYKISN